MSRVCVNEDDRIVYNLDQVESISIKPNVPWDGEIEGNHLEARFVSGAKEPMLDLLGNKEYTDNAGHIAITYVAARLLTGEYEIGSGFFSGPVIDDKMFWNAVDRELEIREQKA